MIKSVLLIVSMSLLLVSCASDGEGYMHQNELLAQIKNAGSPLIVDVRSTSEYKTGHIPGSIHIPFWTSFTTNQMDAFEKKQPVTLYCEHGPRAGIAKLALSMSGFKNIKYLDGHMKAWRKAGLPIEVQQD